MDVLLQTLNEDAAADPLYHHVVTNINSSVWLPVARDRVYILLIHRDLGISVRNKMEEVFGEVIDRIGSQTEAPPALSHFFLPTPQVAQQLAQMQATSGHFANWDPCPRC